VVGKTLPDSRFEVTLVERRHARSVDPSAQPSVMRTGVVWQLSSATTMGVPLNGPECRLLLRLLPRTFTPETAAKNVRSWKVRQASIRPVFADALRDVLDDGSHLRACWRPSCSQDRHWGATPHMVDVHGRKAALLLVAAGRHAPCRTYRRCRGFQFPGLADEQN
jgi:hypothetical protein